MAKARIAWRPCLKLLQYYYNLKLGTVNDSSREALKNKNDQIGRWEEEAAPMALNKGTSAPNEQNSASASLHPTHRHHSDKSVPSPVYSLQVKDDIWKALYP